MEIGSFQQFGILDIQKYYKELKNFIGSETLFNNDKQSEYEAEQIINNDVINLLKKKPGCESVVKYLNIMKLFYETFEKNIEINQAIKNLEIIIEYFKTWENWIIEMNFSKNHFISQQFFNGIIENYNNLLIIKEMKIIINLKLIGNNYIEGYFGILRKTFKSNFSSFDYLIDKSKRDREVIKHYDDNRGYSIQKSNKTNYKEIIVKNKIILRNYKIKKKKNK